MENSQVEKIMEKIEKDILNELKFEKIRKIKYVNILVDGKWYEIDKNIFERNTPFINLIVEKWKKENNKEILNDEDELRIESIRRNINLVYLNNIFNLIKEEMKIVLDSKYLDKGRFNIQWNGKNYEIETRGYGVENTSYGKRFWMNINAKNELFFDDLQCNIIKKMDFYLHTQSVLNVISIYLIEIYEQSMEYKLRSIYK